MLRLAVISVVLILISANLLNGVELLPKIDVQMLTAALTHTESQINSGWCKIRYQLIPSDPKSVQPEKIKAIFAFDEKRAYVKYLSWFIKDQRVIGGERFVDLRGNILICLNQDKKGKYLGRIERDVNWGANLSPFGGCDPREYGLYINNKPISQILKEGKAGIRGVEMLKMEREEIPCYVVDVETGDKVWGKVRLWIAPSVGFHPLRIEGEGCRMRVSYKPYRVSGQQVWFPHRGEWIGKGEGNVTRIEVEDFRPNEDVSPIFEGLMNLNPEGEIWDVNLSRWRPVREILEELKAKGVMIR